MGLTGHDRAVSGKPSLLWRRPWAIDGIAVLILAGVVLAVGHSLRDYALDDPFVTYRYAANLLEGKGFVYSVGENILSTTAAGYGLLLAAFGVFFGSGALPLISNMLSTAGILAASVLVYLIGRQAGSRLVGLAAGLLLGLNPFLSYSIGLETAVYLALILAGFYLHQIGKLPWAAVPLAFATIVRADAVLPAAIVFAFATWQQRRLLLLPGALYAAICAQFFGYLTVAFGSPVPLTMSAKTAQPLLGFPTFSAELAAAVQELRQDSSGYLLLPVLVGLGLVHMLAKDRWALPLVVWAVAYGAMYHAIGVAGYRWYFVPLVPGLALLAGLGVVRTVEVGQRWLRARPRPAVTVLASLLLVLVVVAAEAQSYAHSLQDGVPNSKARVYRAVGDWLRANTSPSALVGTMELGIIGYYSGRPMVDFLGLARPETARSVELDNLFWTVRNFEPDYLVLGKVNPMYKVWLGENRWLADAYMVVQEFSEPSPDGRYTFTIYARQGGHPAPVVRSASDANFGDRFRLRGYALSTSVAGTGEYVAAVLDWQAAQATSEKTNFFVHMVDLDIIVDGSPKVVAQEDVPMQTARWRPGEVVRDTYHVQVPAGTPPGRYAIMVGVQPASSPQPLSVLDAAGASQGLRATIGMVEVR